MLNKQGFILIGILLYGYILNVYSEQHCVINNLHYKKSEDAIPLNELIPEDDDQVEFRWSLVNTNKDVKMSLSWTQPAQSRLKWASVAFCPESKYDRCKPHANCDIVTVWFDQNGESNLLDLWGTENNTVIEDPETANFGDYTLLTMTRDESDPKATITFKRKIESHNEYDVSFVNKVYVAIAVGDLRESSKPVLNKHHSYSAVSKVWIKFPDSSVQSMHQHRLQAEVMILIFITVFILFDC